MGPKSRSDCAAQERGAGTPTSGCGALLDGLRVRELQVRARLLEVADDRLVDAALTQDRLERAKRLDREPHLLEIARLG